MKEKKIVIVTGGANGIGKATCERFVQEGCHVVCIDIDMEAGERLTSQLTSHVDFIVADVRDRSQMQNAVDWVQQGYGRIDILVTSAVSYIMKGLDALESEWKEVWEVNVLGVAYISHAVAEVMKEQKFGSMVHVGSISGVIGQPDFLTYSATKAAVHSMVRCMAKDLAEFGIRVNAVCPGSVWTCSRAKFFKEHMGLDRAQADLHPQIGGLHLLNRCASPEEIASIICFAASNQASFMTGSHIMADGGYTAV